MPNLKSKKMLRVDDKLAGTFLESLCACLKRNVIPTKKLWLWCKKQLSFWSEKINSSIINTEIQQGITVKVIMDATLEEKEVVW